MAPSTDSADSTASSSSTVSPASDAQPPSVLVVFDYDWSLVDDDSDLFIFRQLHPELLLEIRERYLHVQWTQLMDEVLLRLARERPEVSAAEIRDTLARIPVQPRMLDAVRLAAQEHGARVHIVSDANTIYIQSLLERAGIAPLVHEVHSNPAFFDETGELKSRLRVERYHGAHLEPHGCPLCQVNMCKGRILDETRAQQTFTHVLYVGDGKGDFCPATRLSSHDIVFARGGAEPDGKPFELLDKIHAHRSDVRAAVVEWRTGDDLYRHFHRFFSQLPGKVEA
ncbi:hypothetical protein PybrP1_003933 [[Pythium] brassicae (nom. inval.)]|nr:hypothetical protein PybrP1_003933 [[Pythium] brassicae (nom. inval.)]